MDEITPLEETTEKGSAEPVRSPVGSTGKVLTAREMRAKRMLQGRGNPVPINWFRWLVLPVVFLLGLGAGWLVWGSGGIPNLKADATADTQVKISPDVKRYDIPTDGDPSIGPDDAPITIIEFSDYQCPYCVRWYQEVHKRLMEAYKGKIRFVYRDFPLYSIHPEAQAAAEAADCAGEQNAYWPFHDALFSHKNGLGSSAYLQYASELGLDTDQFGKCVSERRYKAEVDADFKFATKSGVSSTPTFFVNGLAVIGAQPFEVFQQIIEKELAGEIPK